MDFQPVVIIKSVTASLFMLAILFGISAMFGEGSSVSALTVELILGIVIYRGALFAFKTFSKKEIGYLKRIFS